MLDPDLARSSDDAVDQEAAALGTLAAQIHAHPELKFDEHRAAGWIGELLTGTAPENRGGGGSRNIARGSKFTLVVDALQTFREDQLRRSPAVRT